MPGLTLDNELDDILDDELHQVKSQRQLEPRMKKVQKDGIILCHRCHHSVFNLLATVTVPYYEAGTSDELSKSRVSDHG